MKPTISRSPSALLVVAAACLTAPGGLAGSSLPENVSVRNTGEQRVGSLTLVSSSRLSVSWTAPTGYAFDHYAIVARESVGGSEVSATAATTSTSTTLTGLKAGTAYTVVVKACINASCSQGYSSSEATGTTGEEYWQVQGTGSTNSTSTIMVSGSSVLSWPMRYGLEAGHMYQRMRLYYKPQPKGSLLFNMAVAEATGVLTSDPTSVLPLTADSNYGLRNPSPATTLISSMAAFQAVPHYANGVANIRLFFEAEGSDHKVRFFSLDSQDGLMGVDFHPGTPTTVTETADWDVGGVAQPAVVIGISGDATFGDSGLANVRQSKVGVPLLTSWLWDEAVGTFMVITGQDTCGVTQDGLFYAQWDGTRWQVEKDTAGCARALVPYAHGPVVLHLGGTRFKLYYEDRLTNGNHSNKPLRLVYGDGASSGGASLEYGDWEAYTSAREVHFVWPDGTEVSTGDESGFGDHSIFYPTDDPAVQFMFMNLTGLDGTVAQASRGLGMAVLLNP